MSAAALQLPYSSVLSSDLYHLELDVHHTHAAERYVLYTSIDMCCTQGLAQTCAVLLLQVAGCRLVVFQPEMCGVVCGAACCPLA